MRAGIHQACLSQSPTSAIQPHLSSIRASIKTFVALSVSLGLLASIGAAQTVGPRHPGRYVPPAASYIIDPTETPIMLQFGSAKLSDIQTQLNAARAANADSPIVLTLTGTYLVKDQPLNLPFMTSLVLYGTIEAVPGATATSLISISGQSKVAIAGGILEGNFAQLAGIDAEASTKINIDAVTIRNTGRDGIILNGNGNTVFDSGSTITRCEVSGSRGNGITVQNITQTLLLDNSIHDNKGDGVELSSAHSSVVNNSIQHNGIGVFQDTNDNLISDNDLSDNQQSGLQLTSTSSNTAVLRNIVTSNLGNGIDFDGTNNLVYDNALSNRTNLSDHSSANWVVAHGTPIAAPVSQYFYPPTIDNQHNDLIRNGMGRTDITVNSEDLTAVQQTYNAALQQNPNNFIVLHMNGTFTADTAPLTLSSNTSVLLNGTISLTTKLTNVVTATNPASYISISGGTIDAGGQPIEPVYFPSAKMIDIDHLTVINAGQPSVRTSKSMIHMSVAGGYNILYRNTVNESGGRCIWLQSSSARNVVLENQLSNCNMDAIDFDSSTSNSFAIDNVGLDNLRYGVFVEQSDSYNKLYGNFFSTRDIANPPGHGIGVYNNATSSGTRNITDGNTVFSNVSSVINNGFRVGSISTATGGVAESAHTFMFNNIAVNNTGDGILFDTEFPASIDNYFSQMVLSGNKTDLSAIQSNGATPPDFFNPMSAINLALNRPATASSTAPGSDPANAVDGLAFTSWNSDHQLNSWLTVDFGTDATFQRVVLKQTSALGANLVSLQRSEDGVHFTDVPGSIAILGSVGTLRFAPVTARYVRLQIWNLFGSGNGVQEMEVFPE